MRVGIAQLGGIPYDVGSNVQRAAGAVWRALAQGAQLVVLPELALVGYGMEPEQVAAVAEDISRPGPGLTAMLETAREAQVNLVVGFAERAGGAVYNSAAVIRADGSPAGVYRKLHLFDRERTVFAPGDRGLPVFAIDGARLGVLICYDLRFPEALRILALQGADLVTVPTAWIPGFDASPATTHEPPIPQVQGVVVQANLSQVF